jgi:hypothetical protein
MQHTKTTGSQGAKNFTPPPPSDTYHEITAERIKEDVSSNVQSSPPLEIQHPPKAHEPHENLNSNNNNIEFKDSKNTEE